MWPLSCSVEILVDSLAFNSAESARSCNYSAGGNSGCQASCCPLTQLCIWAYCTSVSWKGGLQVLSNPYFCVHPFREVVFAGGLKWLAAHTPPRPKRTFCRCVKCEPLEGFSLQATEKLALGHSSDLWQEGGCDMLSDSALLALADSDLPSVVLRGW